jgi:hypothetical protein
MHIYFRALSLSFGSEFDRVYGVVAIRREEPDQEPKPF